MKNYVNQRPIDKLRRLLQFSTDDRAISTVETGFNQFLVRCYTSICCEATYLFTITVPGGDPVTLLVPGKDLYSAAASVGDDVSIEGGVQAYLRQGAFENIATVIDIKVYKLNITQPVVHLDYNPANKDATFHRDENA